MSTVDKIRISEKELKKQAKKSFEKEQKAKNPSSEKNPVSKPAKQEKLDKKNLQTLGEKVTNGRIPKWNYPEGCDTPDKRKTFRKQSRNALKRLESQLAKIKDNPTKENKSELIALQEELDKTFNTLRNPEYK